ncbi:uncharacterized protein LOC124640214 [Helicoverpa zea]|uniref:uncharacterized protein LOC124640214 n=1 Tax=Helicoverpa zea TaxID=7113 RepID=UPI001F574EF4|nr:uncharacterized protein LOC124640214 [Helicoverpa zea]
MYSMCVKIALCLALVACIDGHVLRTLPLSPEGVTVEIVLKNKNDQKPLSTLKIDINEHDKMVRLSLDEALPRAPRRRLPSNIVPMLGNRAGMVVGSCPAGFTFQGRFCVPVDY